MAVNAIYYASLQHAVVHSLRLHLNLYCYRGPAHSSSAQTSWLAICALLQPAPTLRYRTVVLLAPAKVLPERAAAGCTSHYCSCCCVVVCALVHPADLEDGYG